MPLSLSQLFTVVSPGRTNATPHPLTKLWRGVGIELRSPEYRPRVATAWRLWSIHVEHGRISVIRIHVIMQSCHRYCDPSLFLKYCHRYCDSSLVLKYASRLFSVFSNSRRFDHESSRRFVARHDLDWQCRSWLSWLSSGFCRPVK